MAPVLGYWKTRGLGVSIRYLLEHVGEEYQFKAYEFENAKEWAENKDKLGLLFPNLPYYIDGNTKLSQSMAILKYLGRKHQLVAKGEADQQEQDMLDGVMNDLLLRFAFIMYTKADDFEAEKAQYQAERLIPIYDQLERHLSNKKEYLLGSYLTYTDFVLYERLEVNEALLPGVLDAHPHLKAYQQRMANLPGVKDFRESDRFIKSMTGPICRWNNV